MSNRIRYGSRFNNSTTVRADVGDHYELYRLTRPCAAFAKISKQKRMFIGAARSKRKVKMPTFSFDKDD